MKTIRSRFLIFASAECTALSPRLTLPGHRRWVSETERIRWRKFVSPTRRPRGNCISKEENWVQAQVRHVAPEMMKTYRHIRRHALNAAAAALELFHSGYHF